MRALDLTRVLGNQANVDELLGLLQVIESTDWSLYPDAQSMRYTEGEYCLGRNDRGADFLFYDPWIGRVITWDDVETRRARGRPQLPAGHPTGGDFSIEVPGWDGRHYRPPATEDGGAVLEDPPVAPVEYLGREQQYRALGDVFATPSISSRERGELPAAGAGRAGRSPRPEPGLAEGKVASPVAAAPVTDDDAIARRFLREAGVEDERLLQGSWEALVAYTRGRFA